MRTAIVHLSMQAFLVILQLISATLPACPRNHPSRQRLSPGPAPGSGPLQAAASLRRVIGDRMVLGPRVLAPKHARPDDRNLNLSVVNEDDIHPAHFTESSAVSSPSWDQRVPVEDSSSPCSIAFRLRPLPPHACTPPDVLRVTSRHRPSPLLSEVYAPSSTLCTRTIVSARPGALPEQAPPRGLLITPPLSWMLERYFRYNGRFTTEDSESSLDTWQAYQDTSHRADPGLERS